MSSNESQEKRSYGMAVGLFFALFIGQNLVGLLLFGAYATGILPLIECGVLAALWQSHKLNIGAIIAIAIACSIIFPMAGIWAYQTRYGI
ncbi:hypothetical protein [Enorma phocaeensis]|uniref:hypothetical protein n=1 Tax=Enorma phocaeensis TaxID=1871019 RepID=UPI0023539098|nr:hypothetical protein [Enorma phocaeensis]